MFDFNNIGVRLIPVLYLVSLLERKLLFLDEEEATLLTLGDSGYELRDYGKLNGSVWVDEEIYFGLSYYSSLSCVIWVV